MREAEPRPPECPSCAPNMSKALAHSLRVPSCHDEGAGAWACLQPCSNAPKSRRLATIPEGSSLCLSHTRTGLTVLCGCPAHAGRHASPSMGCLAPSPFSATSGPLPVLHAGSRFTCPDILQSAGMLLATWWASASQPLVLHAGLTAHQKRVVMRLRCGRQAVWAPLPARALRPGQKCKTGRPWAVRMSLTPKGVAHKAASAPQGAAARSPAMPALYAARAAAKVQAWTL